jgi:hypothetical protein
MEEIARVLIMLGSIILFLGVLLFLFDKVPYVGKLPGDILIKKGGITIYFPIVTCLVVSVVMTIIFSIFKR